MVSLRNIRFALALLVTAGVVGIVIAVFLKSSRTSLPEPVSQQLPRNIDVALNNARFSEMSNGTPVWELVAKRAEYDKTGEIAYLTDIQMVYAKSRTNGAITLTASRGDYTSTTRNIRLRGNVHVVTESGMRFDTESLDYQAGPALFTTAERVDFHHERLALAAQGMELDAKTETSHFFKSVDAVVDGVQSR